MSYSYGDLASPDLHDVAMDDSDDDLMGPSVDSVTMDDLQFFINELEAPRTSHLKDKPHDNTNSQARDRVHHSQSQNQSHQPAPLANITTDRHQTVPERPIRSSQVLCTICFNYKIVAKCYGIIICAACKIFIYKVSRSEKQVTCDTGHYDCRILYTDTKRCQACRLKKAYSVGMKHPSLPADFDRYREIFPDPSQDVSQARHLDASTSHASQQTIEPSLQADNSVLQDEPSYTTNHSPSKQRVMVCDVCGVEDAIRKIQRYYNINSCAACGSFIYYYATKGIYSYKCVTGRYDCDISRAGHSPGKPICRGCRLRRVAELQPSDMGFPVPGSEAHEQGSTSSHQNTPQTTATSSVSPKKQASQAPLPSNSDHLFERSSKDNCCICENPNYVQFRSLLGILCCKNCFEFLLRTAEKEKSFKCHGRGDCAVEWRPNMRKTEIMCPACRWKKATQQPNFKRRTLSNIAPIPVEPTDSQKTATSSVSPKKQASQAPLPPSSDHSFEGSSKDNCCICNNPNFIQFRSFLGLRCCMNCSGFLSRAVKKKKSFKCRGRGNCTIEWRPNIPKGEICNACRWKKATQQPNFKHRTLSNIVPKPAEPTDSPRLVSKRLDVSRIASNSTKKGCAVCAATRPRIQCVFVPRQYGIAMCTNCYSFTQRCYRTKRILKCPEQGRCTIQGKDAGDICSACRWKAIIENPDFLGRRLWKGHSEKGPTDGIVASQPANDSCRTSHSTIEPTDQHLDSSPETTEELDSHHTKSLRGTISDLSSVTSFDSNSDSNSESSSESSSEYSSDSSSDSSSSPDSSADSSSHTIISTNPTHDSDIEDEETIAGPDDEIPVQPEARPAAEIRIMTANELDGEVDEFGLPLKIEERFSRWLYGDLSCFLPGSSRSKKRKHEVKPGVARRLVTFSNKLDGHFTYLTSDIDVETCLQPVGELFTPVLEIRPSVSLLKAHALSTNGTQDGDCNSEKKTKPLLTFILESRRTIVDRRPMLERRKAAKKPSEEKNQESELSASLIGPGEDCDAADPIIEIDCDI